MDSATEVRYGGVVVGRSPQLRDRTDAGAFIVFSDPLPVGTALVLKIDDKEQPARVIEVVESADASAAGMRVHFGVPAEDRAPAPKPMATVAPAPAPRAEPAAPAAAAPEPASVPVPVAVGGEASSGSAGVPSAGDASAQHPAEPHAHHDRRKRRRK